MSYWEHAARMRELEEQPPAVLLGRIGNETRMLERSLMPRAVLRPNGMLVGFDREISEAVAEGHSFGLGFKAMAFIAWQERKYLLFEDCAVASSLGGDKTITQHHTILVLVGEGLGTYTTASMRGWTAPVDPEERRPTGMLDAPHPFLRRIQAMLELYDGVESPEALRILEIELEELSSKQIPLSALDTRELVRVIEIIG